MKKQAKPNSRRSSRYLTREQAKSILEFLDRPELPEHNSPFKLYLNGKLVASAAMPRQVEKEKSQIDTNQANTKTQENDTN